jgi:hypothetical protein
MVEQQMHPHAHALLGVNFHISLGQQIHRQVQDCAKREALFDIVPPCTLIVPQSHRSATLLRQSKQNNERKPLLRVRDKFGELIEKLV